MPLLVRTSIVAVDDRAPTRGIADEDDDADDDADDGAEIFVPPELHAAARTPAAASGAPNLRASKILLDPTRLFICCAFSFSVGIQAPMEYRTLGECLAPFNTPPPPRQFGGCPMSHITG